MRQIFGWSLPPGVTNSMIDPPEGPCDVCGKEVDSCICPECPVCREHGNPDCYPKHDLVCTPEQVKSKRAATAEVMFQSALVDATMDRCLLDVAVADEHPADDQQDIKNGLHTSEADLIAWANFVP